MFKICTPALRAWKLFQIAVIEKEVKGKLRFFIVLKLKNVFAQTIFFFYLLNCGVDSSQLSSYVKFMFYRVNFPGALCRFGLL